MYSTVREMEATNGTCASTFRGLFSCQCRYRGHSEVYYDESLMWLSKTLAEPMPIRHFLPKKR